MGLFGVVPSYKIVTLIVVLKWYNLEPKDENKLSFQILTHQNRKIGLFST